MCIRDSDYIVPEDWIESGLASQLSVGSLVRIQFRNRSIGGWISEINPETKTAVELQPLRKFSSQGPSREVVEIVRWAANRWQGPVSRFMKTASPQRMVKVIPPSRLSRQVEIPKDKLAVAAFEGGPSVVRIPPTGDRWPYICLLYTSPSPRDRTRSRMPSSA